MKEIHLFGFSWLLLIAAGCPQHGIFAGDGGARQGGAGRCVETQLCVRTSHWDAARCACVPNDDGSGTGGDSSGAAGNSGTCLQNQLCIKGAHWDTKLCKCVPDASGGGSGAAGACVQNQLCIQGAHWDTKLCKCVPDASGSGGDTGGGMGGAEGGAGTSAGESGKGGVCVQNQLCIKGNHWDPKLCKCVPADQDAGPAPKPDAGQGGDSCKVASDCHGVLPHICAACANPGDGGLHPISGCAHWVCKNGQCETSLCD